MLLIRARLLQEALLYASKSPRVKGTMKTKNIAAAAKAAELKAVEAQMKLTVVQAKAARSKAKLRAAKTKYKAAKKALKGARKEAKSARSELRNMRAVAGDAERHALKLKKKTAHSHSVGNRTRKPATASQRPSRFSARLVVPQTTARIAPVSGVVAPNQEKSGSALGGT